MHSRFNDDTLDQFFQRLNKPLKRMPQPARAELHTELRQHLEALAAAHEELGSSPEEAFDLALRQFGDPARIGRKLWWEWFLSSRKGPSEDFKAVLYALGMYAVSALALPAALGALLFGLVLLRGGLDDATAQACIRAIGVGLAVGIPGLAGWLTGRKYPRQAVPAMYWAVVAPAAALLPPLALAALLMRQGLSPAMFGAFGVATLCGCLSAYAGSVRKTGKRRLSLADFKLRG